MIRSSLRKVSTVRPTLWKHQPTITLSCFFSSKGRREDVIIPGAQQYGSLGDIGPTPAKPAAPWQAEHNIDVQRVTQKALIYELCQQQTQTIESVVPWFLENMPSSYFRQVPERFRMDHMKAIAAVKDANMDLYLNLKANLPDGREIRTFIRPGTEAGTLLHMVEELPWRQNAPDFMPLSRIHVFSMKDDSLSLNMFIYGDKKKEGLRPIDGKELGHHILDYAEKVQNGEVPFDLKPSRLFEKESLQEYIAKCSENYINIFATDPRRFLSQRLLFEEVSGTDGTALQVDRATVEGEGHYWVDVAVANSLPQTALENLCRLLYVHQFDIERARLDNIPDGDNGSVTMLRMLVHPIDRADISSETFELIGREIKRSKWLDPATMKLVFERYPHLGVTRGEVITGFCSLLHPIMAKVNALAYSKANIFDAVTAQRFIVHASAIADLFLDRFNPKSPLTDDEFQARCKELTTTINDDVEDTVATELFHKMIQIVSHTLKTNVYLPDRYALSLRLDPKIMEVSDDSRELPYGVFFIHGRRFNGYHVRFRDISRGGLRLVTPRSPEQYALESARHYEECYGLAFAQQLKNKDIPEGGSKAVCLINLNELSDQGKPFVVRKSVKAFTDAILDCIVTNEETEENIIDRFGKREILYLGPDEQVISDDINWIVKRAARRGYPTPASFMSSKPRAGINHKEYGVTSEGVNVYLDVALRRVLGINPNDQPFTVKITGGPDGDVAGNEIKILIREYGSNARIVGIADASGCAEDPDGLNHDELSRMIREALPIINFDPSKLGPHGQLHDASTHEGVKARNSMHNRLEADAFLPCGGRPNTIDITNCKHFLKKDGTPSSKLIVEGANLFITAQARQRLFDEAGVVIVKDSSANKGGVITSSYEIIAAMLVTEDEFFNSKEQIVKEVLEKLRALAKLEAELLFREFETFGGSLPEVSQIISNCINTTTDALTIALDQLSQEDRDNLLPLFRAHLPKTLADMAFDHVHEKVPEQYIKNAISSCLASKIVYREGTKFVAAQPKNKLAQIALKYVEKEKEVAELAESLEAIDMPEKEKKRLLELLRAGGARTALHVF